MIGSYMEKTFCIDCKKTTNHNNGECLSCVNRCRQEQDTLMRIEFGAKNVNQKVDYLFETLVLGNKRT